MRETSSPNTPWGSKTTVLIGRSNCQGHADLVNRPTGVCLVGEIFVTSSVFISCLARVDAGVAASPQSVGAILLVLLRHFLITRLASVRRMTLLLDGADLGCSPSLVRFEVAFAWRAAMAFMCRTLQKNIVGTSGPSSRLLKSAAVLKQAHQLQNCRD